MLPLNAPPHHIPVEINGGTGVGEIKIPTNVTGTLISLGKGLPVEVFAELTKQLRLGCLPLEVSNQILEGKGSLVVAVIDWLKQYAYTRERPIILLVSGSVVNTNAVLEAASRRKKAVASVILHNAMCDERTFELASEVECPVLLVVEVDSAGSVEKNRQLARSFSGEERLLVLNQGEQLRLETVSGWLQDFIQVLGTEETPL